MLLASCPSARVSPEPRLPPLDFPEIPRAEVMEPGEDGRTVTVDADWIIRIAEFSIRYDALIEEYSELRDIWDFSEDRP